MFKLNILTLAAAAALPQASWALDVSQDQGVLNIEYAKISKPYEYKLTMPEGCLAENVNVDSTGRRLVVKHTKSCGNGATLTLTVRSDVSLVASLQAGTLHLVNFNSYEKTIGNVSLAADVGTVNVPARAGFRSTSTNFVGRSYVRDGSANGPTITAKVKYGQAAVN